MDLSSSSGNVSTGGTNVTDGGCLYDTNLYKQITGTIIFAIVWPFVVLDMKWFPLGRPAAALAGAAFMVLFQILSQDEVYEIEGQKGNLQAMFLLVGMMMLSYYYDREGLLRVVMLKIFGQNKPFHSILWKVCLMSALLASFITNDATCLVVTPLILTEFVKQGRDSKELLPLCLGIATSANIGSAATIFGNPQNAFIASNAGISLLQFFIAELPAAILGIILNIGIIYLFVLIRKKVFKSREGASTRAAAETTTDVDMLRTGQPALILDEREAIAKSFEGPQDTSFGTGPSLQEEKEAIVLQYDQSEDSQGRNIFFGEMHKSISLPVGLQASSGKVDDKVNNCEGQASASQTNNESTTANGDAKDELIKKGRKFRIFRRKIFIVWLIFVTLLMIVLLAIPPSVSQFNLGCIPLAASIFTMLMDTILNRKYAYDVMVKIDWTVILMFMGLFVWLRGFQWTCFPYAVFKELAPYMNLKTIEGVLLFSIFVVIGSNVFSNVPLVILIIHRISGLCGETPCEGPLGGLLLAWISTIAGNFTLIGSVANLIVAEKARSSAQYRLSFLGYLVYGFPSTLLILYTCLPVVYYMGLIATKV